VTAARWRRRAALLLAALLLPVAVVAARMLLGARAQLVAAAAAALRGDHLAELRHLRRSMAYYVPGNPYVQRARDGLLAAAAAAEARRDAAGAVRALLELRSAVLALRGLHCPYAEVLPEVNRRLAALLPELPDAAPALRDAAGRFELARRLERPPEPSALWTALALLGFLGWVGGAATLLLHGLRPDAALVARRFWPLAGFVAASFSIFCLALARA
jgi:hypothetical protein